jgi:hypothetical protein
VTASAATDDVRQPCGPSPGVQVCSGSKNPGEDAGHGFPRVVLAVPPPPPLLTEDGGLLPFAGGGTRPEPDVHCSGAGLRRKSVR